MDLFAAIKDSPLLRPNAIPVSKNIGVVCLPSAFPSIPEVLLAEAKAVFVVGAECAQCDEMGRALAEEQGKSIPVFQMEKIIQRIDLDVVFYHHAFEYGPMCACWRYLRNVGYDSFYTFMPIPYNTGITTTHIPGYYSANKENLERVFAMLADAESRAVFAARVRAVESGNIGFIKVSAYEEYFHPLVRPECADTIMDGGVSENVLSQLAFIKAVGPEGRIFGFEPDPVGFCAACERIKAQALHDVYKVIPFGMWHKRDTVFFEISGQGTHVTSDTSANAVGCECISIDDIVAANRIRKVDFIKMDVEGSEINALKGSLRTLKEHRPKLAISLYHKPQDLYFIPLFLQNACDDYEFYIGHHHASLHETVLYCRPR